MRYNVHLPVVEEWITFLHFFFFWNTDRSLHRMHKNLIADFFILLIVLILFGWSPLWQQSNLFILQKGTRCLVYRRLSSCGEKLFNSRVSLRSSDQFCCSHEGHSKSGETLSTFHHIIIDWSIDWLSDLLIASRNTFGEGNILLFVCLFFQPGKKHELPLSIITYVGCGVSILGCVLTIITYAFLP